MPHEGTPSGYRTDGLWAASAIAFAALVVGCGIALLGMLEFGEHCTQGLTEGPGRLLRVRDQAFPPATVCAFEQGEVASVGGRAPLGFLLWAGLVVMVVALLGALVAECLDPRPGSDLVRPMSRTEKVRRTGAALFVLGSVFLMAYFLAAWRLLPSPSAACSDGDGWSPGAPRTLDASLFPPQATCRFASGETRGINPDWLVSFVVELTVPALLAAFAFGLALRRRAAERADGGPGTSPLPGRRPPSRVG
ncbi:hypothetical protein [Streptomyces sp. NPDC050145]|uniref:hypothetical protein n=1 Tax=Streptomyces sp. NPDC050145 TaxID=3365602 RepID=UPI00378745F3